MVAEVALALVLLVSAGLLLRSLERLFAVAPGFDASHVLTMQVQNPATGSTTTVPGRGFSAQALEAVRQVPGVAVGGIHQPVAAERRLRILMECSSRSRSQRQITRSDFAMR